jgi:hypothetical protein
MYSAIWTYNFGYICNSNVCEKVNNKQNNESGAEGFHLYLPSILLLALNDFSLHPFPYSGHKGANLFTTVKSKMADFG